MKIIKNIAIVASLLLPFTTNAQTEKLSPERMRAVDSLALEKIRDLGKYIAVIGNKSTSFSEGQRVVDRALELFAEDSQMGVSSLAKPDVEYFPVKEYFKRLMALNYDKVDINWYDVHYISNLEKQPDGRYVGVITIFQRFEGTSEDGLNYKDTTKKDITVYIERKQIQIGGKLVEFWDVLLGDVKVTETSA